MQPKQLAMPANILKHTLISLCVLCFTIAKGQSLQQNLDTFSGMLITNIQRNNKAQAYLVTDKFVFKPGETIWFHGFLLNEVSQKINSKCKYLFVDGWHSQ